MDHPYYMRRALDLARRAEGFTSPNPMVGAVVVKDGRIVGEGYHQAAGLPHAEVNALDDAGEEASGAILYVTLEPCNHTGRTPPCTAKIIRSGIRTVVSAMDDPNPRVAGGGHAALEAQGIRVHRNVCESEARRLNEAFVKHIRTGRPFVTLKCAATLDGRIATRTGDARWVTGPASRLQVHRLRHAVDGIMVGINTVQADDPSLTTRLPPSIRRLVISRSPKYRMRPTRSMRPSLPVDMGTTSTPRSTTRARAASGTLSAHIIRVTASESSRNMPAFSDIDRRLSRMIRTGSRGLGCTSAGSRVIAAALAAGIVDKVMFFYAPKILGGDDGVPICAGPSRDSMADSIRVTDVRTQRFEDDLLVEGYVHYPD